MKILACALTLMIVLSGCTTQQEKIETGEVVKSVNLPDGRTVICVNMYYTGGVDCDWEHAK